MGSEVMMTPAAGVPGFIVGLVIIFYVALFVGIPFLYIFSARSNWRTMHKKETVVEFVGFWRRIAIGIIDMILTIFIVPVFFNIYYYFRDGQTIGDKIFGTKLVDKKSMKTAAVGQLFIRKIARVFSFLSFGFGFITAGWRSEKRAWHDGLADVRYISYKKVHGAWTWAAILLPVVIVFVVIPFLTGFVNGYQEAALQAAEMSM